MTENAAAERGTGGLAPSTAVGSSPTDSAPPSPGSGASDASADVAALAFDRALEELRDVVVRLEDGRLPLEESIALYERGVALHEHCGRLLEAAELRVQRLVDAAGGATRTLDLRPGDEDDET